MIGRGHRFHGHNSLRTVYQHGHTERGPLFAFRSVPNERRQTYRVAVVVSKKVSKSAVVRNRIRRRLYELIRLQEANIVRPYDIVITVFTDQVADMPANELQDAFNGLLVRAGLVSRANHPGRHGIIDEKEH